MDAKLLKAVGIYHMRLWVPTDVMTTVGEEKILLRGFGKRSKEQRRGTVSIDFKFPESRDL